MREWIIERLASESSWVEVGTDQLQATAAYITEVARQLDTMAATCKQAGQLALGGPHALLSEQAAGRGLVRTCGRRAA
jgi:hypothetical protein